MRPFWQLAWLKARRRWAVRHTLRSGAAAAGQDALADSTTKAGKAAKGALASFDELNVLQKPDEGAGGAAGADDIGGGVLGDLGAIDPAQFTNPMDAVIAKADEMKAALMENRFFLAFSRYYEAGVKLFNSATEALRPVWDWLVENIFNKSAQKEHKSLKLFN